MLDTQDIAVLQKLLEQHSQDIKADVGDKIQSSIMASEKRMMSHMNEAKIKILTELQTDMAMVKQHLKLA